MGPFDSECVQQGDRVSYDLGRRVTTFCFVAFSRAAIVEGNATVASREMGELKLPGFREADEAGDEEEGLHPLPLQRN